MEFNIGYSKLNLMVPTYKRWNTSLPVFINTATQMVWETRNICFTFCVNEKDEGTRKYLEDFDFPCEHEIILENLEKPNLAKYFNMMYDQSKWKDDNSVVVSMLGDDMEFATDGYDHSLLGLINYYAGVGVFWCNDDFIAHERCCVNMFVTRKFVDATEEPFMCEKYEADMIDYLWTKVGKYTKTSHYIPDTIIRHNHASRKREELWDETYKRLRPAQKKAKAVYGKTFAKDFAWKIAERLKEKGMTGKSIC